MTKIAKHSWEIWHEKVQASGCTNRKVSHKRLKEMPWLRGTCHVCSNYESQKHIHHDSPIAYNFSHNACTKEARCLLKTVINS